MGPWKGRWAAIEEDVELNPSAPVRGTWTTPVSAWKVAFSVPVEALVPVCEDAEPAEEPKGRETLEDPPEALFEAESVAERRRAEPD